MRRIVAGMWVSVDGVVEAPETFTGSYFHPELGQHIQASFANADTLLLGRVTYQAFGKLFIVAAIGSPVVSPLKDLAKAW